ncbi:hypothetical protein SUGI_0054940 [Cryptomeria japonica]|nr:hypothetical protein SUGI_0054940 [Cryptomeria japonica]
MEAISFASQSITMRGTSTWGVKQKRRRGRYLQARCDIHNEEEKFQRFSEIAVSLTIVSAGFPQAAVAASAEVKRKKVSKKKEVEAMPLEERKAWTAGLPVVADKIPYTDILEMKAQGRLKHIIKHPLSQPKARPEIILAVFEDDRVLKVALPAPNRDANFWNEWDRLELGKAVIEAYTPPLPKPPPTPRPLLEFLERAGNYLRNQSRQALQPAKRKGAEDPQLLEVRRKRLQLERQRIQAKAEQKLRETREAQARRLQKQMEERQQREEEQKQRQLKKQQQAAVIEKPSDFWRNLTANEPLEYALGILFFMLFYVVFILSHKKRRKDHEDRQKIYQAEQEEKEKMRQLDEDIDSSLMGELNEEAENNEQLKASMQFLRSGARVRRAKGPRRPTKYLDTEIDVKFSDVAGLGEIRKELEEIVEFFKYSEMYRRRGTKIPSGILLCGEPGTGKTLLAKAVAGEAGVSFLSISASQFVEMYVGVGASRVRGLYEEAKENAPSVVFIDELDAVGRTRGIVKGSGGQERDATVNQLLTCLDGFEGKGDVITIAATNRPDVLDAALVRPGRFDRKIYIPKPSLEGRIEILKLHAQKKPMADDVDYEVVARLTEGMAGADLANILDVAALNIIHDGRSEITTDDLIEAINKEDGALEIEMRRSMDYLQKLALNEAASVVVSLNFIDLKDIRMVTIASRAGRMQGAARFHMDVGKFMVPSISRQTVLDHITVQLAARAADEIWNGPEQFSTIWANTFQNARVAARELVFAGLSDKKELYALYDCLYEVDQINEIDAEALKIVNICYERAKKILLRNRRLVDVMMDELITKETLKKENITSRISRKDEKGKAYFKSTIKIRG